nr:Gag-Pol polyprotein [Tanacetum cinerariifolium]
MHDKEVALKLQEELQAEFDKEQRLAKEQQVLNDAEKATLFMQLLEKRRKFFATKRAEEKRNITPTRAQQRCIMCTYLKNMEGWKLKSLKNKPFVNIQELFDKAMKRVNAFVDYRTELVEESSKKAKAEVIEGSSKRAGIELEQESSKKQKIDDDKETAELKQKLDISFLYVFEALCYPKNNHEDIRKLGAKGDIGFFIGYSANSCTYRVYNRRTKKIIEPMC